MTGWSTGASFFHPDYGLKAGKLADAVRAEGPVLVDERDQVWIYEAGVWRPDAGDVRRRTVRALGERMRDQHLRNLLTVLRATVDRFEAGPVPALLNLESGMLRWAADPDPQLLEHHPEYMSTVRIPVPWDPGALCPRFDDFLAVSVPADDLERAWQVIGYLLMSGNPLQRMFMLTGSGGNGKGVFLNIIRAVLGKANFVAVPLQDFSENRFSAAQLFGKLANICGDIDSTYIQSTGRIKQLSGDDPITAERKGEHPFEFLFWGKAIFSANAIPGAADSSRGWLRRWEVVEFPYAPTKPDPELSDRIVRTELPGILVKAVYALRGLMAEGEFSRGESADNAHAEFAEKANRVIRWMHDSDSNVLADEDCWNKGTILLSAFRQWDAFEQGNGHKDIGVQRFNELARQAGLTASKRRGVRGYYGLRVRDDAVMIRPADRPHLNLSVGEPPKSPPMIESEVATLL